MINDHLLRRLHDLLSTHGEVSKLTILPEGQGVQCTVLATMKSTKDAYSVKEHFDFPLFGFNTLIIGNTWIQNNLMNG